ncbi:patatin-like phospholipase family protein [Metasolibacillus meyeri]|uniref:patatin-like phospholipase family protein n=1 Tax=Metasolibacillus meyeri TaxID=1071052 RepID=UPI000D304A5F|nr:patatin-like phospholipase family protein [Metasolibacillus meyeri]
MSEKEVYPLINEEIIEKLKQSNLSLHKNTFSMGQLILEKGQISQAIHIIVSGKIRVFIAQERKIELAILREGQFFGEMSCLTSDPVSAHVEAVDEVQTVSLNRDGMMLLMNQNAAFRLQIIESMVTRIQNSNERVVEEHQKSLLLLRHHEHEVQEKYDALIGETEPMVELRKRIHYAAQSVTPIVCIGEAGTEKISVAKHLHDLSTNGHYPFVLIDANQLILEKWQEKLQLAQGGTIVVEHAELLDSDLLKELMQFEQQVRIVFTTTKKLTQRVGVEVSIPPLRNRTEDIPLLATYFARKVGRVNQENPISEEAIRLLKLYPFLQNNVEELKELVEKAFILSEGRTIYSKHLHFVTNRKPGERPKIDLALGSGVARGQAHIGVLQILEEEGIPIDMVAGTSIGAVVGGAYAAGMSVAEMKKVLSRVTWGQLVRPTVPFRSFVENTPVIDFIERHLGKRLIENLPTPFAAVASDALTGEAHIMKKGSLAHALRASSAVPAVMRPVQYEGRTLVDGAVVHPVPAALVKSMGADIVIGVNVCAESFAKGMTRHVVDSLMNTIDMMSAKLVKEELQLADVIIRPDLGFNQIRFGKELAFCISSGKSATRQALDQLYQIIEMKS